MGMSQTITTGYTYYGSAAQVVCIGSPDILHSIMNGEQEIYSGPIYRTLAMDGDGKTVLTTTIGTIRFYWGTATQNIDDILAGLIIDQGNGPQPALSPAYRKICYAILDDCSFGAQTTPPTLRFKISRFPNSLTLPGRVTRIAVTNGGTGYLTTPGVTITLGGGSGATATAIMDGTAVGSIEITSEGTGYTSAPTIGFTGGGGGSGAAATAFLFHELSGDALLPECIYEALTDTFYGAQVPTTELNTQEFVDACATIVSEDLGVSPELDSLTNLREVLGKWMPYMDGVLRFVDGKIGIKLIRAEDTSGLDILTVSDFVEEPVPTNQGFEETANFIRITFTDGENNDDDGVEHYDDPANAEIVGRSVDKEFNYPYVTRREVAKQIAQRVGPKMGVPPFLFDVTLTPEHATRVPGDMVKVTYSPFGFAGTPCRIMEVNRGSPSSPDVEVKLLMEQTRDTTNDYVPAEDFFTTPPTVDDSGTADWTIVSVTPRLSTLPSGLKAGKTDGLLVAFDRTSSILRNARIGWTWDEIQKAYADLLLTNAMPHAGQVIAWTKVSPTNWILRVRFPNALDLSNFANAASTVADLYFVVGHRDYALLGTPQNVHQIDAMWGVKVESGYFVAVDADMYDIEVTVGSFGSTGISYEGASAPANSPTLNIYWGRQNDFAIIPSDTIMFDRSGPNAPVNPSTGLSDDTTFEVLVKVAVSNWKNVQSYADVTATEFDRDDTTMSPQGTYTPDWGQRALTGAELLDRVGGDYFMNTSTAYATLVDDLDSALGALYDGTATADQKLLLTPVDLVLGSYYERWAYSDNL